MYGGYNFFAKFPLVKDFRFKVIRLTLVNKVKELLKVEVQRGMEIADALYSLLKEDFVLLEIHLDARD